MTTPNPKQATGPRRRPARPAARLPGGRKTERDYHRLFAAHRLHGEWFEPHPDILAEINRLTSDGAPDE